MTTNHNHGYNQKDGFCLFYYAQINIYQICTFFILDQNPRLSSNMIGVMYLDYISLLIVCDDLPLTLKTGGGVGIYWNQTHPGFP